jgi:beta-glucosidase
VPLAEAASFNVEAIENAARIAAVEASAHGLHWTFAPMVDIARDPRWGRIVEGAGEDPYLGAQVAAAKIRGFQGADLAANDTILATAKHFVAYGAAEGGRDYNTADVSIRTLREIYLPPFQAAVRAGVQTVMAAFNEVEGVPMHANNELIQGVLRGEWGFDGVLISDYNGIAELIAHGVAANEAHAGVLALGAGLDIDMGSGIYAGALVRAMQSTDAPVHLVDTAVRRVLQLKYRLGLFDDPYRYSDIERERARTLTPEHREAARDMACQSMVLLKNSDNLLPLGTDLKAIAVLGPLADDRSSMLGSWSAAGHPEDVVTPLEGIRAAVSADTQVLYAAGVPSKGSQSNSLEQAKSLAHEADVALLFLGERADMSGEAKSRSSLDLPADQMALARAVVETGTPVAVVLFTGRPLTIDWLDQNVHSILLGWYPGLEAGRAIADVLFGLVSPAGRLPVTFPRNVGQIPTYYNHKNTGRPPNADVTNTSKYIDAPWTPLYSFGYGMSYTKFRYSNPQLSKRRIEVGESVQLRVELINTGDRAGDEVVQVYLRDNVASVTRPVLELSGFRRVHLGVNERVTLSFEIGPEDMALYGLDMQIGVERGQFSVFVGGDSSRLLETAFEVVAAKD